MGGGGRLCIFAVMAIVFPTIPGLHRSCTLHWSLRSLTRSVSLGNALAVPGPIAPRVQAHRLIVAPA